MKVAVERRLGRRIDEVKVAVQGGGHVGLALCELLHSAGAQLVIAESRAEVAASVAARFGAEVVSSGAITQTDADVFAPCALGGVLNLASLSSLKAKVICGAANNQLAVPELGDMLAERGVLYAPDYLVNSGGIINVAAEHLGWSEGEVAERVDAVASRLQEVLNLADKQRISPARAADLAAREVIQSTRTASRKVTMAA